MSKEQASTTAPSWKSLRAAYVDGLKGLLEQLSEQLSALSSAPEAGARQDKAIATRATLLGALLLARAMAGDALSVRILDVVRQHMHAAP